MGIFEKEKCMNFTQVMKLFKETLLVGHSELTLQTV